MAPPVNRKATERAMLAIFGGSSIRPHGTSQLTAEAVEMHEFSSDSECSTLSSDSDTHSAGSQDEEATQWCPDVDDTKTRYDDKESKLPDLICSTNPQTQEFLGAQAAATTAATTAATAASTAATEVTATTGTAERTAATQTYGDMKAVSKPNKKQLISL